MVDYTKNNGDILTADDFNQTGETILLQGRDGNDKTNRYNWDQRDLDSTVLYEGTNEGNAISSFSNNSFHIRLTPNDGFSLSGSPTGNYDYFGGSSRNPDVGVGSYAYTGTKFNLYQSTSQMAVTPRIKIYEILCGANDSTYDFNNTALWLHTGTGSVGSNRITATAGQSGNMRLASNLQTYNGPFEFYFSVMMGASGNTGANDDIEFDINIADGSGSTVTLHPLHARNIASADCKSLRFFGKVTMNILQDGATYRVYSRLEGEVEQVSGDISFSSTVAPYRQSAPDTGVFSGGRRSQYIQTNVVGVTYSNVNLRLNYDVGADLVDEEMRFSMVMGGIVPANPNSTVVVEASCDGGSNYTTITQPGTMTTIDQAGSEGRLRITGNCASGELIAFTEIHADWIVDQY